jgi:hypothetical protein
MQKVDVVIHTYGKPWQTLCALKSLMLHSGQHIDKIYATEEKFSPYEDTSKWAFERINNVDYYVLKSYYLTRTTMGDMNDIENRWDYKYQYGIERSDKKYVFILHNDILFLDDIIGNMLSVADGYAGVGLIGQCWNCSVFHAKVCDGERHDTYNPTYEEVEPVLLTHPPVRGPYFHGCVNKEQPMPLPECRLNEFACLIDREITMKECYPNGNSRLFGNYDILDCGAAWFRDLFLKGYRFKQFEINKDSTHGYFSLIAPRNYYKDKIFYVSGHPTQQHEESYWKAEQDAKEYYEQHFK